MLKIHLNYLFSKHIKNVILFYFLFVSLFLTFSSGVLETKEMKIINSSNLAAGYMSMMTILYKMSVIVLSIYIFIHFFKENNDEYIKILINKTSKIYFFFSKIINLFFILGLINFLFLLTAYGINLIFIKQMPDFFLYNFMSIYLCSILYGLLGLIIYLVFKSSLSFIIGYGFFMVSDLLSQETFLGKIYLSFFPKVVFLENNNWYAIIQYIILIIVYFAMSFYIYRKKSL